MKTSNIPKNPEITLIFVNFRSARLLRISLQSLLRVDGSLEKTELIIANNDVSEEWALRALLREFPVRVINLSKNIGFGGAANIAARYACAPYIGFINPDTEHFFGKISDIGTIFRKYPDIGVLGARLVSENGQPERWSVGEDVSLWQIIRNNFGVPSGRRAWKRTRPTSVGFVSGAALFIRKSVFDSLGGFDERFFLYFEDADLCLRAKRLGYRVCSFPGLVFRHKSGASHVSKYEQKRDFYVSQERYFGKHRPKWEGTVLSLMKRLWI